MISPSELLSFAGVSVGVVAGGAVAMLSSAVMGLSVGRLTRSPKLVVGSARFGALVGILPSFFVGLYIGAPMGVATVGPELPVLGAAVGWAFSMICGMGLTAIASVLLVLPITLVSRGGNAA